MTVFREDYSVFYLFFVYLFLTCVRTILLLGQELGFPDPAALYRNVCGESKGTMHQVPRAKIAQPKSRAGSAHC